MNAFVKKEIRLLLPSFIISLILAASMWLVPGRPSGVDGILYLFPFLLCPAMVVMMALQSFGAEVTYGTLAGLLAQPVEREKIWRIKTRLLGLAVVIVGMFWWWTFNLKFSSVGDWKDLKDYWDTMAFVWLFAGCVFSGGLWTVLLLRQVAAAFWFTLLTPAALWILGGGLLAQLPVSENWLRFFFILLLGGYALAGGWLARRLFFRAQDLQWTGGNLALPETQTGSAIFKKSGRQRVWRPRAALWWKELMLHQSQIIMAGVLVLVHLGVILTRTFGHFQKNSTMEFIVSNFWLLWLVMPVLVGCAAVAEERKLGTLDSQFCLAAKRRTQFLIKLTVALGLGIFLGLVLPFIFEGHRILPELKTDPRQQNTSVVMLFAPLTSSYIVGLTLQEIFNSLMWTMPFLLVAGLCALVTLLAFYASSLSRNTLQALAPAALLLLLVWLLIYVSAFPSRFGVGFLWRGSLVFWLVLPAMLLTLLVLLYRNFKIVRPDGKVWMKNGFTLTVVLLLTTALTSATYHRAWELLSPIETPHGAAQLTRTNPPRLQINNNTITVYLPDGRVWMNRYTSQGSPFLTSLAADKSFGGGQFLEGTNWTTVRDTWTDIIGIQRDGSLWVSETPDANRLYARSGFGAVSKTTKLIRFGERQDWKGISVEFGSPILLKTDGELWRWEGTNRWQRNKPWPGLKTITPQAIAIGGSDWERLETIGYRTFFIKTNGQVWVIPRESYGADEAETKISLGKNIDLMRRPFLENAQWRDLTSGYFVGGEITWLGVAKDGSLRKFAEWGRLPDGVPNTHSTSKRLRNAHYGYIKSNRQIGNESDWLASAQAVGQLTTLKKDGTIWKWNFWKSRDPLGKQPEAFNVNQANAKKFSQHSDWVAIASMNDDYSRAGIVSLAADGSLYLWRFERNAQNFFYSDYGSGWLQVSRKPQLLGNIFAKTE